MGKTIFAAVISAVLVSIATCLVFESMRAERRSAESSAEATDKAATRIEIERLARRIADLEKRPSAAARGDRHAAETSPAASSPSASGDGSAPATTAPVAPGAVAPDGTPYVSRAELEQYVKHATAPDGATVKIGAAPPGAKTLEEIAREQNLSAAEEANLRNVFREAEEEMVHCLFGDRNLEDVRRDVLAAKEDPDKQGELMQTVMQNAIGNLGKIATAEARTKKKVEGVLGADRAKSFMAVPRKPVLFPDLEDFMHGF